MRARFLRRWILLVSIGEASGFAVATAVAILTIVWGTPDPWRLLLVVAAGAVEGAALATGQYAAMGSRRPRRALWVGATAGAASLAWLIGMLPSSLGLDIDLAAAVPLLVVGGLVLLATIPVAQWLALRRKKAARWIPVTMAAWLVAIAWTAAPSPFVDEASPIGLVAALYVVAGALMAVTVASLTARTAWSLFGPDAEAVSGPESTSRS